MAKFIGPLTAQQQKRADRLVARFGISDQVAAQLVVPVPIFGCGWVGSLADRSRIKAVG